MDPALLNLLACPRCDAELRLGNGTEPTDDRAVLVCQGCRAAYGIINGVPRLNEALTEHRLANVARTFSFEWNAHHKGEFEADTLFGRTQEEDWAMVMEAMKILPSDVEGATVLDAGCGSGRFCQLFADHGAATVVGVDMNEAVDEAARHYSRYPNIHIVQGNIFALPFRRDAFDLIWCNGVVHHTPDAAGAHRSLAKHVRPGGVLYVWVYAARFNPFRFVKSALRPTRLHRWPPQIVQRFSAAMAYLSYATLGFYRLIRSTPGLGPRTAWGKRTIRPRTLDELKLTWFDALSPEFDTRHTEAEVVRWFHDQGFVQVRAIEEPKVGVRGVAPSR